ncbi:hypothetical protein [Nocardia terpenica]|uniref:Uncharacterized protein n=1 Tax=Nocardia terpenica TaxID=455432 RepID=A0A6G9ZDE1_9NOCA|nr:hypothetical protein [Nocardia terpenica]QIS23639.1 hypothetical protein F6W96_40600 [Nocardia terpenica]
MAARVQAADVVVPPSEVTAPLMSLLGQYMWLVAAALTGAAIVAGAAFADSYRRAEGSLDRAATRILLVAVATIGASSASAWAVFFLT